MKSTKVHGRRKINIALLSSFSGSVSSNLEPPLDWTSSRRTRKVNSQKIIRAATISRPPLESSWQGEIRLEWSIFVKFIFDLFFQNIFPNNAQTKIHQAELDSPRRILVCGGLRPFWGPLDWWQINFYLVKEVMLICVRSIISRSHVSAIF